MARTFSPVAEASVADFAEAVVGDALVAGFSSFQKLPAAAAAEGIFAVAWELGGGVA